MVKYSFDRRKIWTLFRKYKYTKTWASFTVSALHKHGVYEYLMNEEDKENLKWLHVFKYFADLIVLLFLIIDKEISTVLLKCPLHAQG